MTVSLRTPPRTPLREPTLPEFSRLIIIPMPRLRLSRYRFRIRRYVSGLRDPVFASSVADALREDVLRGARVDYVRVHPVARQADGTPLRCMTRRRVRALLRSGRVLSRDARLLAQGLEALGAGARLIRLGTPHSLQTGSATEIR